MIYLPEILNFQSLDLLWDDYADKLQDQALGPIASYSSQFGETKVRVDKRGRKLLDYDSARHALVQMQSSKKPDDAKAAKVTVLSFSYSCRSTRIFDVCLFTAHTRVQIRSDDKRNGFSLLTVESRIF